jgi:hypothetical protein
MIRKLRALSANTAERARSFLIMRPRRHRTAPTFVCPHFDSLAESFWWHALGCILWRCLDQSAGEEALGERRDEGDLDEQADHSLQCTYSGCPIGKRQPCERYSISGSWPHAVPQSGGVIADPATK